MGLGKETSTFIKSKFMLWGFPGGTDSKESTCNSGDPGSIPGSGRSPEEGNGNSLQYSCLEYSAPYFLLCYILERCHTGVCDGEFCVST